MDTLELGIGQSVCVDGGKIKGVVKGVERREDESVCGLILKSREKMVRVDLRENAAVAKILACDTCPGCAVMRRPADTFLN